jgi:excisionase family DNA binding protein
MPVCVGSLLVLSANPLAGFFLRAVGIVPAITGAIEGVFQMDVVQPLAFTQTDFQPQVGRSVSIEQAAQLLNVSRRTVYYRIRDGRLRTIRTLGGSQRVLMDSVEEMRMAN